jgi:hypothetical protein
LRHSLLVRITHWLTALSVAALLVSGVAILIAHPRLYWGETGSFETSSLIDLDGGFAEWRLPVDGLVARPMSLSLADLKALPGRSQITLQACEEGWSFIAEWTGAPLSSVLETRSRASGRDGAAARRRQAIPGTPASNLLIGTSNVTRRPTCNGSRCGFS